jgi:hypothetical protein
MKYGKFDWGNQITSNMPKSKEQGLVEVEVKAKDLIYMMQRLKIRLIDQAKKRSFLI